MRKLRISLLVVMALLVFTSLVSAAPPESKNFGAKLSGEAERPVPRETDALGNTVFNLSNDGTVLRYRLIVANIANPVAAHIHCGGVEAAGPVGVNLFIGGQPGSGPFNGVLAAGEITAPNPGNACGWLDLQDVVDAMLSGNAYVNVHTNDNDPNTSLIPGDFPGGEIRGQIVEHGPSD